MSSQSVAARRKELPGKNQLAVRIIFGSAIFISAFLLFQVQLLMAKFLLPWFGGAAAVWTTCMLFFQILLLGGYAYAHLISTRLRPRWQLALHFSLLAASLLMLGVRALIWNSSITPGPDWKPLNGDSPITGLLFLLSLSIGLPFLLLSATTPLLQRWLVIGQSVDKSNAESTFKLYALSNAGSMLGLLSYPFLVEPNLRLPTQARMWTAGYFCFAVLCGWCAKTIKGSNSGSQVIKETTLSAERGRVGLVTRVMWFSLELCGSLMLLATTNLICQDLGVVPLLWVLPLGLYLLTFILCFGTRQIYRRKFFLPAFAVSTVMACLALQRGAQIPMVSQIYIYSLVLLMVCMVCHGELSRLVPDANRVTAFYLTMSAGGAAGGLLVGVAAPLLFNRYWEYQIGLLLAAVLALIALFNDKSSWIHEAKPWVPLSIAFAVTVMGTVFYARWGLLTPLQFVSARVASIVLGACTLVASSRSFRKIPSGTRSLRAVQVSLWGFTLLLGIVLLKQVITVEKDLLVQKRNFYGVLRVKDRHNPGSQLRYYELLHGRITHGIQIQGPEYKRTVTSYYTRNSGVGLAILNYPRVLAPNGVLRIGAVGLGVGTIAAYARPGDLVRFYEINPQVIKFAIGDHSVFSFLENSAGRVEIVRGDARISLEREAEENNLQQFDILVLDAFSGDAIPVHLLTREAIQLYLKHLRGPESVLAIHTSNRALSLAPIVAGLAQDQNLNATYIMQSGQNEVINANQWILLSQGTQTLNSPNIARVGLPLLANTNAPLWTDDYSNLLSVLRH